MDKIHSTRNIQKKIFAIPTAAPAMPPKPKTAAINAIISKVIVQSSDKEYPTCEQRVSQSEKAQEKGKDGQARSEGLRSR